MYWQKVITWDLSFNYYPNFQIHYQILADPNFCNIDSVFVGTLETKCSLAQIKKIYIKNWLKFCNISRLVRGYWIVWSFCIWESDEKTAFLGKTLFKWHRSGILRLQIFSYHFKLILDIFNNFFYYW